MPGYHLPPEWAPQSAVMLTWPHGHGDWRPWLGQVEPVFAAIAREVSAVETLLITAYDAQHREHILRLLQQHRLDMSRIHIYIAHSNDTWVRDHGPITVYDDQKTPTLIDFVFNGWGQKFNAELDNAITVQLHQTGAFANTPLLVDNMVMEGGSIEVDGHGTLLTTRRCLLSPKRNPQMTQADIERRLAATLGISRVLWLDNGYLAGDDTDSHIDTLARFCDPHTICYVACDDPDDEHYPELKAMEQELKSFCDYQGNPYRLAALPWPQAKYNEQGDRLPASYANFLIINQRILVPTYEDAADQAALDVVQSCFPQHKVIGIPCLPLIFQYGSLHCVTMQLPRGTLP